MLTRRTLLHLSSLSGLTAGLAVMAPRIVCRYNMALLAQIAPQRNLLGTTIVVPKDFLGMHFHRYPEGKPLSPAPSYSYGAVRSHDYAGKDDQGVRWSSLHVAPHTFRWGPLDTWIASHSRYNRTIIYTLYGTPRWLAKHSEIADDYGSLGGCAPPKDLAAVSEFIVALLTRYNSKDKRIQFIEIWNEPAFHQDLHSFWTGSAAELAAMGKAIYQTAKAVDPTIRILSPGFNRFGTGGLSELTLPDENAIYEYLSAPDGAGNIAGRWCDALAIHTYEARIVDASHGIEGLLARIRRMLKLLGLNLPIYNTEIGYEQKGSDFAHSDLAGKASLLRRQAAVQAALGVRGMYFYSHDDDLVGDPSRHVEIAHALDEINSRLAGKTLRQVTILGNGKVRVESTDGTFVW